MTTTTTSNSADPQSDTLPTSCLVVSAADRKVSNDALKGLCANNAEYFAGDDSEHGQRLHISFLLIGAKIDELELLVSALERNVSDYDFDEHTPGNGYRSFLLVVNYAVQHATQLNKKVCLKRDSVLFRKTTISKEIDCAAQVFASLVTCLNLLGTIREHSPHGSLFATDFESPRELLRRTEEINQYCFYGRSLGFQYNESLRGVLQFISLSMAIFSEAYYLEGSMFSKATNSMVSTTKYLDPELRARRIVNISRNADVHFCKAFWFLSESELMHYLPSVVAQKVAISRIINIPTEPLSVVVNGKCIDIPAPTSHIGRKPVQVRLISYELYEGMVGQGATKRGKAPSKGILFHCHGGGFVAQSSRSHETYLRQWSRDLDMPILSLDYSLAPSAPYPRALEEALYAYCWVLNNCALLGTTGERIVAAGDSAGANLLTAMTLKCIDMSIPTPAGLFLAYAPTYVNFTPSPARLLCMMDPLLPYGILLRCLQAYVTCGNGELKSSIAADTDATESFEEISESDLYDLQAHKSPTSDMSDTLTYGSLSEHSHLDLQQDNETKLHLEEIHIDFDESDLTGPSSSTHKFEDVRMVPDSDTDTDATKIHETSAENEHLVPPEVVTTESTGGEASNNSGAKQLNYRTRLENFLPTKVSNFVSKLRKQMPSFAPFGTYPERAKELKSKNGLPLDIEHTRFDLLDHLPNLSKDQDPFISPYCARDDMLRKLPPVKIVTVHLDPCLDDCVMFAKRLKSLNKDVHLDILNGLPHGFLNFSLVSKEAYDGSKLCVRRILELFKLVK